MATSGRSYVDWDLARTTGRRLVSDGPETTAKDAAAVVADLRQAAANASQPVADTARMDTGGAARSDVHVVDRGGWIDVNVDSTAALLSPVLEKATAKKAAGPVAIAVGAKITGAQIGALLGFVAPKILGQFDLAPGGRPSLLLVAPNIVSVERELNVDPTDFRSWVCLHEETHRVQFTAVPWLRGHVIDRSRGLMTDLMPDPDDLQERLQHALKALPDAVRGGGNGLMDLFTTAEQREQLASLTAVMSLLEGHADVVMDDVGPKVVPSVAEIRRKFDQRRKGAGGVDRLLRRLLGLEAKMRQYRDGAVFCRAVIDKVGVDGFNAVWSSPDTLPSAREIEAPADWVARVHG
ncbi:zinc-dependent metalloprotease [Allobranchiibius sp. GilTou38]|uniref:zinc-dependent metalloprotease n=1 Tax=Allobranchiibius sp. GilTou38 TaxID=2815210 RepID=UPI001AA1838F|nr:zinc-dependent metalloprotease [Allobranchiibius sp. GilTou38]MBO1766087.1 zinc-dependent metalloprotease [Allobranchiibius sp. GilTou38]